MLTFIIRFQGLDPCLDYPCANNGTCVNNGDNTFKCICPSGVPGDRCQDREYFPYYKFHAEIVFVAWLRYRLSVFQENTSRKFLNLLLFYLPVFWLQLSSAFATVFAECHGLCVYVQASWYTALFRVSLLGVGLRCVGLAEKIFARGKLSNTPKPIRFVKGSLRIVLPEVDSRLIENLINHLSLDGNAYRKSICKTLRKYFASNYQGLLKMFSNRLHSTRLHSTCLSYSRPVIPQVDLLDT